MSAIFKLTGNMPHDAYHEILNKDCGFGLYSYADHVLRQIPISGTNIFINNEEVRMSYDYNTPLHLYGASIVKRYANSNSNTPYFLVRYYKHIKSFSIYRLRLESISEISYKSSLELIFESETIPKFGLDDPYHDVYEELKCIYNAYFAKNFKYSTAYNELKEVSKKYHKHIVLGRCNGKTDMNMPSPIDHISKDKCHCDEIETRAMVRRVKHIMNSVYGVNTFNPFVTFKPITTEICIPKIKSIYFNNPYTTIKWYDDSVTVVKCVEGETFSKEIGLGMAIAKKYMECCDNEYPRAAFKRLIDTKSCDIQEKIAKKAALKKNAKIKDITKDTKATDDKKE